MSDMHFFWLLIFAVAALMAAFHHLEKNKKD
jgi:hypothetical protein